MKPSGRVLFTFPWALTLLFALPLFFIAFVFSPMGRAALELEVSLFDRGAMILFLALGFLPIRAGWANRLLIMEDGDVLWIRADLLSPIPRRQILPRASLAAFTIVSRTVPRVFQGSVPSDSLALRLTDGRLLRLSPQGTYWLTDYLRAHGQKLAAALHLPMEEENADAPDEFWA